MLTVLLFLGFSIADPAKADDLMKAQLDMVKLAYACDPDGEYQFRVGQTRRLLSSLNDVTSYETKDVSDLDRGLRSGKIKPDPVDKADCKNLLFDAQDTLDKASNAYSRD